MHAHARSKYRPKHVVVHYIVIKYTTCDTVLFDYIQFFKLYQLPNDMSTEDNFILRKDEARF